MESAAEVTPGTVRRSSSVRFSAWRTCGMLLVSPKLALTRNASTCSGSKPRDTCPSRARLRMSSPDPTNRTIARATCALTSRRSTRCRPPTCDRDVCDQHAGHLTARGSYGGHHAKQYGRQQTER